MNLEVNLSFWQTFFPLYESSKVSSEYVKLWSYLFSAKYCDIINLKINKLYFEVKYILVCMSIRTHNSDEALDIYIREMQIFKQSKKYK